MYTHLRVFGCLCYAHNKNIFGDKFASRGVKCVFLGYAYSQKGWKVYDLKNQRHFVSRDVRFLEHILPFADKQRHEVTNQNRELVPGIGRCHMHDTENHFFPEYPTATDQRVDTFGSPPTEDREGQLAAVDQSTPSMQPGEHSAGGNSPSPQASHGQSSHAETLLETDATQPTGKRQRRPPKWHQDYEVKLNTVKICTPPTASISSTVESDPRWREAMQREIDALERTGTWRLEPLPPGKRAIYCKWVYKIKYTSTGSIERYKARLVVCGNRQVAGIDYTDTFAPVAKMVTVRTILAIATSLHWELHQIDVDNVFLHGDLREEVYMHLPPGYSSSTPGMVCRLLRSLYGLRQAPRCWFSKLTTFLKSYGFVQSHADYSLFTLRKNNNIICVLVYVDDLLIT
ncbi:unnamed protein product, partial [Cuscuta europaea]